MVKEAEYKSEKVYLCEACDMKYRDFLIAEECEEFCKKYNACNTEIITKAIK